MEKIKYYIIKYRMVFIISMIILVILCGAIYKRLKIKETSKEDILNTQVLDISIESEVDKPTIIKVDIKGYVENPGVYELDKDSRVIDVINKAGGLKEDANTEYINLSKKIVDEMVIIIYSNSDLEEFKQTEKEIIYIEYECVCPDNINDACISEKDVVNTNNTQEASKTKEEINTESLEDTKISINKSTKDELMTLNGIGESKAKAIIEYREKNGEFKSLEDVMDVPGIGEAVYSKIKDNIKL